MKAYVGITDRAWYETLSAAPHIDEVNFWQPGGTRVFRALQAGELFLFKLHSPDEYIVGGGVFAHASLLPVSLAWDAFGIKNGADTLATMRSRVERYRRRKSTTFEDYTIGCILLEQPFFLSERDWIPVPSDWARNIVQGRTYDLTRDHGRLLSSRLDVIGQLRTDVTAGGAVHEDAARYGTPILIAPRLGQGTFRVVVTDAYRRTCAVTKERTLTVLEAAHIRPYTSGGEHRLDNGLLLRSDIHTLFDRGYVTVTPEFKLEVSRRIREEFENGRDYYALHGRDVTVPVEPNRPARSALEWHNASVYLG